MSLHERIEQILEGRIKSIGGELTVVPAFEKPAAIPVKNYLTKKQVKALKALVRNLPPRVPSEMLEHMRPLFAIIDDGGDPYLREARYQLGIIMRPEAQAKLAAKQTKAKAAVSVGGKKGPRKESAWIKHVKKTQACEGISYKEALKLASKTYHKK